MSRKKHAEAHENHERWLVSYADFITLLFAFFVVMYSVSSVNEGKFRVLADSMVVAFRSPTPHNANVIQLAEMVGEQTSQATGQPSSKKSNVAPDMRPMPSAIIQRSPRAIVMLTRDSGVNGGPSNGKAAAAILTLAAAGKDSPSDQNLAKVMQKLQSALSTLIRNDMVNLRRNEFWIEVEIKNSVLFPSGSATVNREAMDPLGKIADILREISNRVQVEGFTDNRPINTSVYPSNWELSAARAASVVHILMNDGVHPERMSAVGYGEYQPIADNSIESGRIQNRRVVLVIMGNIDARYPVDLKLNEPGAAPAKLQAALAEPLSAAGVATTVQKP
ncbi:MAG: flagellar motor protein MotD [Candidatus Competibacteraceae bacterium]